MGDVLRRFYWRAIRWPYLRVRKRLVPWCISPGCWRRSVVSPRKVIRGRVMGGRGNVCSTHFWEALQASFAEVPPDVCVHCGEAKRDSNNQRHR